MAVTVGGVRVAERHVPLLDLGSRHERRPDDAEISDTTVCRRAAVEATRDDDDAGIGEGRAVREGGRGKAERADGSGSEDEHSGGELLGLGVHNGSCFLCSVKRMGV